MSKLIADLPTFRKKKTFTYIVANPNPGLEGMITGWHPNDTVNIPAVLSPALESQQIEHAARVNLERDLDERLTSLLQSTTETGPKILVLENKPLADITQADKTLLAEALARAEAEEQPQDVVLAEEEINPVTETASVESFLIEQGIPFRRHRY